MWNCEIKKFWSFFEERAGNLVYVMNESTDEEYCYHIKAVKYDTCDDITDEIW